MYQGTPCVTAASVVLPLMCRVAIYADQHGIPVGKKAVQATQVAKGKASEEKDSRGPPEGVTPE